jgi:type I restriction enzyme, S subunit
VKWPLVQLGEIVSFRGGGTPRKDNAKFWDGEIPWATVKDLRRVSLTRTKDTITRAGLRSSAANLIPSGHVIVATRMALGAAVVNEIPVAINQDLRALVPKTDIDTRYLFRMYQGLSTQIERLGSGATVKGITQKRLAALTIPLPPLAEQKRIARVLDQADALRAKRRETIKQLDALVQSVFLDMFGDPVTNPKGWDQARVESIGSSRLGKMLDAGKQSGKVEKFPYLANYNVQWDGFQLDNLRSMEFDLFDREEFRLFPGDILVCEGGEIGRTAIWRGQKENVYFQKALHRVRIDPQHATPEYFLFFMWFMSKNGGFTDHVNSATIAHLTGAKLKLLPIPVPPLKLQKRFTEFYTAVKEHSERLNQYFHDTDLLFSSLQSRAFKGDL